MSEGRVRIGTRGSALALWQAEDVRERLCAAHGFDSQHVEICVIKTSGDRIQDKALREFGGKGLFTKEIEEGLLEGTVDLAVHSMKDMPTLLPDGLVIGALLAREDVRDAFISPKAATLMDLPEGAVVGTSSLRRQAQVKRRRPDLEVVTYRGNVQTRLRKLEEGVVDATLLALAGLKRLGMADRVTAVIETAEMLPAVAQGAIGVEIRGNDKRMADLLAPLHDENTAIRLAAERAFLARLDGSCRTPIAGLAELDQGSLAFRGEILSPDGRHCHQTSREGSPDDAAALGADAGAELLAKGGPDFFAELD